MSQALTLSLTFGAVATAVLGGFSILADLKKGQRARLSRRIDDASRASIRERVKKSTVFKDMALLANTVSSQTSKRASIKRRLEALIEQAGLDLRADQLIAMCVGIGIVFAVLGFLVMPIYMVPPVCLCVGAWLPIAYVKHKRGSRLEKLLSQLPNAFELMSRVIRAGQSMTQAFQSAADQLEPPIALEFAYCSEQQNLGVSTETALRDLAKRTGLIELKILVVGVLVQQQTGGNLAEMLDNLSNVIRERYRMRGVINTLTAEGRMQAWILLGLPPTMYLMMLIMNRPYALELFDHPSLILLTIVSEAIGGLWIKSIVNFSI